MSFQNPLTEDENISEINMTPLVDVMLVLLIIFMITMPVITHSVNVELPVASSQIEHAEPHAVTISIQADQSVLFDGQPHSMEQLAGILSNLGNSTPTPEVRIQADAAAPYGIVARVMASANSNGLNNLAFVSLPQ